MALFFHEFERSGFSSIDRFMAMRPDLADIGRDAIALAISHHQNEAYLYQGVGGARPRPRDDSDWYGHLWNLMTDGANTPQDVVNGNSIRFITFNYETSLERFLCNSFASGFGLPTIKAAEVAAKIPVHHVYGALAGSDMGRYCEYPTGMPQSPVLIKDLSRQIKVMPQQRPPIDEKASSMLRQAQRIWFLGFGFDAMNCARIGIAETMSQKRSPEVVGTVLGLTSTERGICGTRVLPDGRPVILEDMTCMALPRRFADRLI